MRSQTNALAVGAVLAVVILAGCAIWGMIRPQGAIGDSVIVVGRTWWRTVCGGLGATAPGAEPGVGAPDHRKDPIRRGRSPTRNSRPTRADRCWAFRAHRRHCPVRRRVPACGRCVTRSNRRRAAGRCGSSVIAAPPPDPGRPHQRRHGRLLLISHTDKTFLVYRPNGDGTAVRAEVDLNSVEVRSVLRLDGIEPGPVSSGLLALLPEAPPSPCPRFPAGDVRGCSANRVSRSGRWCGPSPSATP